MSDAIIIDKVGTVFVGDATALYRACAIRQAIRFYIRTGRKVNRAYTPTNMLRVAGKICGKTYKKTELKQAITDLTVRIETMKSALPIERGF